MRHSLREFALTIIGLALLGTGCTVTQDGSPSSASTPTSDTTRPGPANRYGAPAVNAPLDATKFLSQPCAALTTAQVTSLNLSPQGEADTTSAIARHAGPSCAWKNSSIASYLALSFMVGNKNGLADYYRGHQLGRFKGYWIETSVDGYPAVFEAETDSRKTGTCDLAVGISDALTFRTNTQSRDGEKSCDQAKQAASLVIQTLKAGG